MGKRKLCHTAQGLVTGVVLGGWLLGGAVSAANAAVVSQPLPPLVLSDADGGRVVLRSAAPLTVINFWATWCVPCRKEIPQLVALRKYWRGWGVRFVGIAVDSAPRDTVRAFAAQYHMRYPVALATRHWVQQHFNVARIPTTLIVDGQGIIRRRLQGPQRKARLMYLIRLLLRQ